MALQFGITGRPVGADKGTPLFSRRQFTQPAGPQQCGKRIVTVPGKKILNAAGSRVLEVGAQNIVSQIRIKQITAALFQQGLDARGIAFFDRSDRIHETLLRCGQTRSLHRTEPVTRHQERHENRCHRAGDAPACRIPMV